MTLSCSSLYTLHVAGHETTLNSKGHILQNKRLSMRLLNTVKLFSTSSEGNKTLHKEALCNVTIYIHFGSYSEHSQN